MRRNIDYLPKFAHSAYLDGLKKTGLGTERIPGIDEMNEILKEIGWAAVSVDGFIPPNAFMEFQAHNVLVIATDIRSIDQVEYTPSPDILHEAAGHAPIIADPEYANYLKRFGEIGAKAFTSGYDFELYEAIRHLSILKADPHTPEEDILEAKRDLENLSKSKPAPSEMERIRNLHWWTVEYGLIGTIDDYKLYGAGLLSSVGESESCQKPEVKKLPYNLDTQNQSFDITTKQPQLFVTPDFQHLEKVLDEFANTIGLRKGGEYAIAKAIDSRNLATLVWSSGLQVSGKFTEAIQDQGKTIYLKTQGKTNLNYDGKQLNGHSGKYHKEGFGAPIGKLKGIPKAIEDHHFQELKELGIAPNNRVTLEFESGIVVTGKVKTVLVKQKPILITFENCKVTYGSQTLFEPSWGTYDMAIGTSIASGFAGAADPDSYGTLIPIPKEKVHKIKHSTREKELHFLYGKVREIRETKSDLKALEAIFEKLRSNHPQDWLLPLEIYELIHGEKSMSSSSKKVLNHLQKLGEENSQFCNAIEAGLSILKSLPNE
jgi:phenylalanine-4-hydroxylase